MPQPKKKPAKKDEPHRAWFDDKATEKHLRERHPNAIHVAFSGHPPRQDAGKAFYHVLTPRGEYYYDTSGNKRSFDEVVSKDLQEKHGRAMNIKKKVSHGRRKPKSSK